MSYFFITLHMLLHGKPNILEIKPHISLGLVFIAANLVCQNRDCLSGLNTLFLHFFISGIKKKVICQKSILDIFCSMSEKCLITRISICKFQSVEFPGKIILLELV